MNPIGAKVFYKEYSSDELQKTGYFIGITDDPERVVAWIINSKTGQIDGVHPSMVIFSELPH